jgi:hypothetical protein
MSETNDEQTVAGQAAALGEFLDDALVTFERVRQALGDVGSSIELRLADTVLDPEALNDSHRSQLTAIGEQLAQIAVRSRGLATGISGVTGMPIAVEGSKTAGTIPKTAKPPRPYEEDSRSAIEGISKPKGRAQGDSAPLSEQQPEGSSKETEAAIDALYPTLQGVLKRFKTAPKIRANLLTYRLETKYGPLPPGELGYRELTQDETDELFETFRTGIAMFEKFEDINKMVAERMAACLNLASAFTVLVTTNLRLVTEVLNEAKITPLPGLVKVGKHGLERAILGFTLVEDTDFPSYAKRHILHAIRASQAD